MEGVKEKSKWNHSLPPGSLFLCTHVAFRQRKNHALKMGNLTSVLWQASISGEIHPVEEGLDSRERSGVFLGSGEWSHGTSGSVCLHPHPKDRLEVLTLSRADVTVLDLPLFTANHNCGSIL